MEELNKVLDRIEELIKEANEVRRIQDEYRGM